ncbi:MULTISPECIES: DUF6351 family protein [unclassified Variovorax]|uniref:DUF6351 family protein n=1 Tax=unclassified Variovorax TaxID=663243 RepID=UPI000F7F82B9|nr:MULTISPECIES: DUF6351 family protein [unclassified Variovorax]RSZ30619.1 hypothetical protein EJO70_32220 [Variovorax sp. 553]RSZ31271.1 hypothetical protein EJO71_32545 [Variovorax sp. 679]
MFATPRHPHKRVFPWPRRPRAIVAGLAMASALLVAGCGGGSDGGSGFSFIPGASPPPATQTPAAFQVKTLSSSPDMISGGDTLLEITAPVGVALDKVRVSLNGKDVSSQVPVVDSTARVLRGLVTGLTTDPASTTGSANSLVVSNAENSAQRTEVRLVNYPITGPILSGPHISPYECRTVQNGLGSPLDADCSAATQVVWYYRTTSNTFKPLSDPTGTRPADLATTTTNDGNTVPYIVRVESGTINRGVYRLAVLDNPAKDAPATWKPGAGWNRKLVVYFDCCGSAQYNQGVHPIESILGDAGHIQLSRGFAFMNSTELWNNQHANPHLQGETLMMLKEHVIEEFGAVPKWTVGFGGSGGAIQQYLIAQLYPGLLDGIQPIVSFPETLMPEVMECRLLNNVYKLDTATWTTAKQTAVNGFNTNTCTSWDLSFASIIKSDNATGCGFLEPANVSNVFNRTTNPNGIRCDLFQTNVNLLGKRAGTQEARRPMDNIGVQYGLAALNSGTISVKEFLDLNEKVGGYDGDGNTQAARTQADPDALKLTYSGGFKNSFKGPGLANIPIITQRGNADSTGDIHDTMQDLIIRARLQRANGRSDNQIIWTLGSKTPVDYMSASLDLINKWLDNMAADTAAPSIDKVVRNKPAGANDACWDASGKRIDEAASTDPAASCNLVYPRFSTPRIVAGSPLVNDVLKCQLKPVNAADYSVTIAGADLARLQTIFPAGVCDWSKPGVGQEALRGTYLRLPLN